MLLYESEQFLLLLHLHLTCKTWNSCDIFNTVFFLNFLSSDLMLYPHDQGFALWGEHGGNPPQCCPISLIISSCNGLLPLPLDTPPIYFSIFSTPPEWTPSITGLSLPAPYYGEGYQPHPRKLPPPLIRQPCMKMRISWPSPNRATLLPGNGNFQTDFHGFPDFGLGGSVCC